MLNATGSCCDGVFGCEFDLPLGARWEHHMAQVSRDSTYTRLHGRHWSERKYRVMDFKRMWMHLEEEVEEEEFLEIDFELDKLVQEFTSRR